MDDRNLWTRIQQGERSAYKVLFERLYPDLCGYLFQHTQSWDEAEDIAQEIFIKLWTKAEKIHIKGSVKSYIYMIAHNAFVDRYRHRQRQQGLLERLQYEGLMEGLDEDSSLTQQKVQKVRELIEGLPQKCREILVLSKMEGLKNREVAEALGLSIKTVEHQLRIAFKKIRKGFEDAHFLLFMFAQRLRRS